MGTTFANMHIKNIKPAEGEMLIPGSLVKQFNPEWVTITAENFQAGTMERLAKKVSKKINTPVLSVEVIDEDVLMLNIFREGKAVARHVSGSGYGFIKNIGKAARFVKELELLESYTDYFKWILKCEDPDKALQLLEKVLALPLWIDYRMIVEGYVDFKNIKLDLDFVQNYIKEKKASEKIKNVTKAKLLIEFDGKLYVNFGYHKYHVHRPSEDNNYQSFKNHYIYSAAENGMLECLFDISINVGPHNRLFITNNNIIAMVESLPLNVKRDEISYWLFNMKGEVIAETKLPREAGYPISVFDDGTIICRGYAPNSIVTKYNIHGEQLPVEEIADYHVRPILKNGYSYFCNYDDKTKKAELIKRKLDGEIAAVLTLKEIPNWRQFLFDKEGNFYYCVYCYENGTRIEKLLYIDKNLNIKNEIELEVCTHRALLDETNNRLYISVFERELLAIDLKNKNKIIRKKYEDDWILSVLDSKGCIILHKGRSTLEVLSPELNIISRHRLKGSMIDQYKNAAGNICLVTWEMPSEAFTTDNVKSVIRVYEIVY